MPVLITFTYIAQANFMIVQLVPEKVKTSKKNLQSGISISRNKHVVISIKSPHHNHMCSAPVFVYQNILKIQ